ncbi:MAG TPA: o-succinylbenzoate synthase [Pirellulales bacterium]|jgi:O-succinylbenzoate synthase|nr:o-succinylbenzoate synthase [Pirellulales bacterium]
MRIDSIELFHVAMPLISPWRTAYGDDATIESVLVCMRSGSCVGWGESSPLAAPCYSPEWAGGVFACVRDWMAPALVGREIDSGDELQSRLAHFKGNPFAKGALDAAWWVLEANRRQMPLHRLLRATRDAVDVGADFSVMDSIDALVAAVGQALDHGYKRVKLKYRPGWDVRMVEAVRREFPHQTLHVDCNAGYTIADAEMFHRLDDFCLAMFEQPLAYDDLVDHARLQQTVRTPICLDESVNSVARAEQAIDLGSCRIVNIKPGRVGGLTPAVKIHNLCREAGIACWVGGMLESAVGVRICAALAMLDGFSYPADIFGSSNYYRRDLGTPPVELSRGPDGSPQVAMLDAPGIGTEPDAERLAAMCLNHALVGK